MKFCYFLTNISLCHLLNQVFPEVNLGPVFKITEVIGRISHDLKSRFQFQTEQQIDQNIQVCEIVDQGAVFFSEISA